MPHFGTCMDFISENDIYLIKIKIGVILRGGGRVTSYIDLESLIYKAQCMLIFKFT